MEDRIIDLPRREPTMWMVYIRFGKGGKDIGICGDKDIDVARGQRDLEAVRYCHYDDARTWIQPA